MITPIAVVAGLAVAAASESAAARAVDISSVSIEPGDPVSPLSIERVGGKAEDEVKKDGDTYRAGPSYIEAPLPDGYPRPTPPGAIEIKHYPSVRRAEFRVDRPAGVNAGSNMAFFPLFRHIERNDIAMTSPVEMDYAPEMFGDMETVLTPADGADVPEGWVMSFLYKNPELGPTGRDGRVEIVDTTPVTVLSIGYRGPYGTNLVEDGLETLTEWLEENPQWVVAGPPRSFYYNGPSIPNRNKWAEVQIPIRAVTGSEAAKQRGEI